ncbi:hypothetical protein B9Z55_007496 [Caenorhabditis nigoni]|uniref:BTB domain-containing protein n=1 Tax=Caenorhabditis nigoni TaxID=1611254 RepID=A0A2G5V9Y9_9PELO|nr:hypothetical protein B9Z55_007496 [Caenorhabditis nigoni]
MNEAAQKSKYVKQLKLKYVFEDVDEFEKNEQSYSEWEDHYNVKWSMKVRRYKNHLGFFIRCEPITPADNWSIQIKSELKVLLAAQSSVFKALLLGNFTESKQSEVKLNGIDPDDFHYFLEILYGEFAIDDTTVEGVALLADMYDVPTVIRRCEEFLLKESKKTMEQKLEIATQCNLETLKEKCEKEINLQLLVDMFD